MPKADPALVEALLTAARAAIADPEVRAKLVPEAVDDVDEAHLRMRIELFGKMPGLQRMVLRARTMKASKGVAVLRSPERAFLIITHCTKLTKLKVLGRMARVKLWENRLLLHTETKCAYPFSDQNHLLELVALECLMFYLIG